MPARKRGHAEMAATEEPKPERVEISLLDRIRSMSEFAALCQFLFMFGKVIKLEDVDIEDLEQECIMPMHSQMLSEIGLSLLKFVSSFRALTFENFEEYTRRQYLSKAPELINPFGEEEEPRKFTEMDVFTKIRILHQLTLFAFWNPEKIREKLPDATVDDQISWRMDPCGWDGEDRIYFMLDDDRLYRQTDAPIPEPVSRKKKQAAKSRSSRSSKRRRVSRVIPDTTEDEGEESEKPNGVEDHSVDAHTVEYEANFEGRKWECVAVSLEEYNRFLDTIRRSRDPDEKNLFKFITSEIIPILETKEEARQKKEQRRIKELENMEKLLSAKRSSRLAGKAEKKKEQEVADEIERKRVADLTMAHKEQEKQKKMEEARESRMITREQRIRDREVRRILHEEQLKAEQEQLAKLSEGEFAGDGRSRVSERKLKADVEQRKKELESMEEDEEDWFFDCSVCGVHGYNLDDGTHSIACEKCNVWQHSACHGIDKEKAERDDFHFVCKDCKKKAEKPVPVIKIKLSPKSVAPAEDKSKAVPAPNKPKTATAPAPNKILATAPAPASVRVQAPAPSIPMALPYPVSPPAAPKPYQPPLGVPISSFLNSASAPKPVEPIHSVRPETNTGPQTFTFKAVQPNGSPARQAPVQSMSNVQSMLHNPVRSTEQQSPGLLRQIPPLASPPRPVLTAPQALPSISSPPRPVLGASQTLSTLSSSPRPMIAAPQTLPPLSSPPRPIVTAPQILQPLSSPPRPAAVAPQLQTPATSFVSSTPYSRNTSFIANGHNQTPMQTPGGPSHTHQSPHMALPAPHLPSPKPVHTPQMAQGSFSNSQNGLEGSSPGYSPMKQVSPPRPSSANGGMEKKLTDMPVTLEPHHIPPVRSPPVKKASPMLPPLHQIAGQAMGQSNNNHHHNNHHGGSSFGNGS